MQKPVLHNYFRSSTSFRVRAALNLKGIEYEYVAHHLRLNEHRKAEFLAINPQGLLPSLVWRDGTVLHQSMAILEFLEEACPLPALLPGDAAGRARVRGLANIVACDIHPVNNLRILNRLRSNFGADDEAIAQWFRHWVAEAFGPLETLLAQSPSTGKFCHGDQPTLADLCLAGQVLNNGRFNVDMTPYPTISSIHDACMAIPQIAAAAPSVQPDAE